jgi:hypothetical protein
MGKQTYYRQCKMSCDNKTTHSWIPEEFAIRGKLVILKDMGPRAWMVDEVSSTRITQNEAMAQSMDHKHQRDVSDI